MSKENPQLSPTNDRRLLQRSPRASRRIALSVAALALLAASCGGSGSDDTATDVSDGGTTETTVSSDETTSTSESAETDDETADPDDSTEADDSSAEGASSGGDCASNQLAGGAYIVTNIPAGDPDGGLVARSGAGTSNDELFVLTPDSGVFPGTDGADCEIVGGDVWWRAYDEGGEYWVNSAFLGKYEGAEGRTAVGTTAATCEAYSIVMDSQETDIWPAAAMIALDVELGSHPAGVSQALTDLVNGEGRDYETIAGYVGPICGNNAGAGDAAGTDQPLADVARSCWDGSSDACDELTGFNMSPEGAVARALVAAVMEGDTATVVQLSSSRVAETMWEGPFDAEADYGIESIQLDGMTFSFVPFPTAATTCQLDASGYVESCTYHS